MLGKVSWNCSLVWNGKELFFLELGARGILFVETADVKDSWFDQCHFFFIDVAC